eukprot:TRINITY_DN17013_c0_g1_i1.p1 TRINITY_DN17013_c0_g1~~TRINITY_DN17013_c0_g1_i1.p1  ORF type:complete len:369 (+),score=63.74 TRINITY_DN17013_c0_g1_i1:57-1163(+)
MMEHQSPVVTFANTLVVVIASVVLSWMIFGGEVHHHHHYHKEGIESSPPSCEETERYQHDPFRSSYEFAIVADLDLESRDPEKFVWRSYLKRGTLHRIPAVDGGPGGFRVAWSDVAVLESNTARNNRSMELSELVKFDNNYYGMCDYTGIVYRLAKGGGHAWPRWALADGNGKWVKPFKSEWATVKDCKIHIGSMGKEWITSAGEVLHRNMEWVKTIDKFGRIKNKFWGDHYATLRQAANISNSSPGYLIHEAVVWDPVSREWFFMPRRESQEAYEPVLDEKKGTNLLLVATEDFSSVSVYRAGKKDVLYGVTSVKLVPEGRELMAIRAKECDGVIETWVGVFDRRGNVLMDWELVSEEWKFEGLEFL